MTTTTTINCNNCHDEMGVVYQFENLNDDMVCLKCYNDLLVQLGMDKL